MADRNTEESKNMAKSHLIITLKRPLRDSKAALNARGLSKFGGMRTQGEATHQNLMDQRGKYGVEKISHGKVEASAEPGPDVQFSTHETMLHSVGHLTTGGKSLSSLAQGREDDSDHIEEDSDDTESLPDVDENEVVESIEADVVDAESVDDNEYTVHAKKRPSGHSASAAYHTGPSGFPRLGPAPGKEASNTTTRKIARMRSRSSQLALDNGEQTSSPSTDGDASTQSPSQSPSPSPIPTKPTKAKKKVTLPPLAINKLLARITLERKYKKQTMVGFLKTQGLSDSDLTGQKLKALAAKIHSLQKAHLGMADSESESEHGTSHPQLGPLDSKRKRKPNGEDLSESETSDSETTLKKAKMSKDGSSAKQSTKSELRVALKSQKRKKDDSDDEEEQPTQQVKKPKRSHKAKPGPKGNAPTTNEHKNRNNRDVDVEDDFTDTEGLSYMQIQASTALVVIISVAETDLRDDTGSTAGTIKAVQPGVKNSTVFPTMTFVERPRSGILITYEVQKLVHSLVAQREVIKKKGGWDADTTSKARLKLQEAYAKDYEWLVKCISTVYDFSMGRPNGIESECDKVVAPLLRLW